jgi:small subunit ribosomal protein S6
MTVKFENQKELRFWNKQVEKITKKGDAPAVVESKEIVEDTVTTEA